MNVISIIFKLIYIKVNRCLLPTPWMRRWVFFSEWADGNSRSAAVLNAISQTLKKTLPEESPKHERWPERLFLNPRLTTCTKTSGRWCCQKQKWEVSGEKKLTLDTFQTFIYSIWDAVMLSSYYINCYKSIIHLTLLYTWLKLIKKVLHS